METAEEDFTEKPATNILEKRKSSLDKHLEDGVEKETEDVHKSHTSLNDAAADSSDINREKSPENENPSTEDKPKPPSEVAEKEKSEVETEEYQTADDVVDSMGEAASGTLVISAAENEQPAPAPQEEGSSTDRVDVESRPVQEDVAPPVESFRSEVIEKPARIEINELDTINQKRQEEKEIFQKLIDDVTRLEHELAGKKITCDELESKLDVCSIELDAEKEKSSEYNDQIKELEKTLTESRAQLARVKAAEEARNATNLATTSDEPDSAAVTEPVSAVTEHGEERDEDEIRNLHQKIKRLTQDDELKSERVAHLETEVSEFNQLISRLEEEVGKDRIDALRQNKNEGEHTRKSERGRVRGNEVSPDSQNSSVCVIA